MTVRAERETYNYIFARPDKECQSWVSVQNNHDHQVAGELRANFRLKFDTHLEGVEVGVGVEG